ncbi:hypothetical protein [Agrobacterium sp. Ap1]|uniref:hypothetical protein n=1 Tax=Agrobacterium sp. Ap1 TaxID=2815337 RepID=UPI001AEF19FD|nr:hypothetical protein [Agrobacterium sp. Ap1]
MNAPVAIPQLCSKPVWSFNSDGTVFDLATPAPLSVCFLEVAKGLSGINRFNGRGISVAQHSVMGAKAVINERGTNLEAALFLLHDAHEWALGDIVRPVQKLLSLHLARAFSSQHAAAFEQALEGLKSRWDEAVYSAANLPLPEFWTARQRRVVKAMDDRMCRAEAMDLFGARAATQFPDSERPKTVGAIRIWGPGKSEEEFLALLHHLAGPETIAQHSAAAISARRARA